MAGARPLLDRPSRISEILFGLIMALTFTGSLSAATAGREEVRTMLYGAIGCNIAWGVVDAVMYLVTTITERGRDLRIARAVRSSADPARGRRLLTEELPPTVGSVLTDSELEAVRMRLSQLPALPDRPRVHIRDVLSAIFIFFLVAVSTFPVVIPFMLTERTVVAVRVSGGVAVVLLFLCGYLLGRYSGHRPWWMGFWMAVTGVGLVALTIALGG